MSTANMQVPLYLHYSGAVIRRTNMVRARTPPHVLLWVFSKHLQKKCLTLNVIFSIILSWRMVYKYLMQMAPPKYSGIMLRELIL